MTGLDTNILVRYFAQDDLVQSATATDVIERRCTEQEPGFVSVVTMAETVWVLDRAYRLGREGIVAVNERMLGREALFIGNERGRFTAIDVLTKGSCAFAG